MKKLLTIFLALVAVALFTFTDTALAGDAASGKTVFGANCAACHAGGRNVINPAKTLQKSDLEKYGKNSIEKIVYQVTNGAGAMPRFAGKLTPTQIEDVATYVLSQSEAGW